MKEETADLWEIPADIRVITTNGTVKKNGEAVMGRGCAREAAVRWPYLPALLGRVNGRTLRNGSEYSDGNHVVCLKNNPAGDGWDLFTFPVKHNWWDKADIKLISRSAEELAMVFRDAKHFLGADDTGIPEYYPLRIAMPRPGCGNGGLKWEDVRPVLEHLLDDRFVVVHNG